MARRADVLSFFGWQPDAGQRPRPRARLADEVHAARPALPACVDSGTPARPLTVKGFFTGVSAVVAGPAAATGVVAGAAGRAKALPVAVSPPLEKRVAEACLMPLTRSITSAQSRNGPFLRSSRMRPDIAGADALDRLQLGLRSLVDVGGQTGHRGQGQRQASQQIADRHHRDAPGPRAGVVRGQG